MTPRFNKILRDLWLNKARTLLVLIALTLGTFGIGADLSAYSILSREISVNFLGTHPPSIIVHVEPPGANHMLAQSVEQLSGVELAEARGLIEGRVLVAPDQWRRILFFVVDDFQHLRVATFKLERGDIPNDSEMLIERSAIPFLQKNVGDRVVVQTPNGTPQELRITGVVHDAAQSPGWMDGIAYGYITVAALTRLGEHSALNELRVTTKPQADVNDIAQRIRKQVERTGATVSFVDTKHSVHHPHADQMESLLFLFGIFGALSLFLGGLLAATVFATLLTQQTRQIGAMKAIGASSFQIGSMYAIAVLVLAGAALTIGIPAGLIGGVAYARFVAGVLNFDLTTQIIPSWVFAVQIAAGLAIPLVAAAIPITRSSLMSVKEAIDHHGTDTAQLSTTGVISQLKLPWFDRPMLLSLRNLFRRKGRLMLMLGILSIAGATFMSALNVSESWRNTVDNLFLQRHYNLQVIFSQPYSIDRVDAVFKTIPGVQSFETWNNVWAFANGQSQTQGYRILLTAVPPQTNMIAYPLIEGRWLLPGDVNAMVINHELLQDQDVHLKIGDTISLDINGHNSNWNIVGAIRELGVRRRGQNIPASVYVNQAYFSQLTHSQDVATSVVIMTNDHSVAGLQALSQRVEHALDQADLHRTTVQLSTERKQELLDHLVVIRDFLLAMASLVAIAGGLSLASMMSINVLERKREIGVMRAVGASTHTVMKIFVIEGMALALLSWVIAFCISLLLSMIIGNFAGRIFVHTNLDNVISISGMIAWLILVVITGLIASIIPLLRPLRSAVAPSLQYE